MLKNRIAIVTTPVSKAGIIPLSNLISIICSISKNVFLITGGEAYDLFRKDKRLKTFRIFHNKSSFFIIRIFYYLLIQLKISLYIFKIRKKNDFFIFFHAGDTLLLPTLIAHLFRKKVLLLYAGSTIKTHDSNKDPLIFGLKLLSFITCTFVDKIIVYSDLMIYDYGLQRWTRKILIARPHFIDFDIFKITKEYLLRECIIGYIGRFSEEKGILYLLNAVPEILKKNPNIKFLFIGDGPLRKTIDQHIQNNNLSDIIIRPGWISHDLLTNYINQMKLLVIPSDTEGLPNVMLEAMACGTPVLATSVGGISSIIKDGRTGFILENNSPRCITSNIFKILDDKKTVTVIENAYQLIQNEFQFEKRVEEFKSMFDIIHK